MIKTFRDAATESLFTTGKSRRLAQEVQKSGARRLGQIDAAKSLNDLRGVGASLETVDAKIGRYAIRVNDKYRVRFTWRDGHAWDVELGDFHTSNRAG